MAYRSPRVLVVFGTRPEAIKMAPVVLALQSSAVPIHTRLCVTAQHREMLDQVLQLFQLTPDVDLDLMTPNQDLFQLTARILTEMKTVLDTEKPDLVLVHGDTTTSMATSLACFYAQVPIGHVEAGLRTFDKAYPFPEEMNRVVTDYMSTLHFPPTERAKDNLLQAGISPGSIVMTGNTVIDALLFTLDLAKQDGATQNQALALKALLPESLQRILPESSSDKSVVTPLMLVTTHRRENFGAPLHEICQGIKQLSERYPQLHTVIPVHPNPNVKPIVESYFAHHPQVHLIAPLDYGPFCQLMNLAHIILTDSGGIQEEAPSLGKPVLVLRDETERPEAVAEGTVCLVGPHTDNIVSAVSQLMDDPAAYQAMASAKNPYGDGKAAPRIVDAILAWWQAQPVSGKG